MVIDGSSSSSLSVVLAAGVPLEWGCQRGYTPKKYGYCM